MKQWIEILNGAGEKIFSHSKLKLWTFFWGHGEREWPLVYASPGKVLTLGSLKLLLGRQKTCSWEVFFCMLKYIWSEI